MILNKGWQEEVDIYKRSENDFSGSKPATYLILDPTQTIFKKFCGFFSSYLPEVDNERLDYSAFNPRNVFRTLSKHVRWSILRK